MKRQTIPADYGHVLRGKGRAGEAVGGTDGRDGRVRGRSREEAEEEGRGEREKGS